MTFLKQIVYIAKRNLAYFVLDIFESFGGPCKFDESFVNRQRLVYVDQLQISKVSFQVYTMHIHTCLSALSALVTLNYRVYGFISPVLIFRKYQKL